MKYYGTKASYMHAFEIGRETREGIRKWIRLYNEERSRSSMDNTDTKRGIPDTQGRLSGLSGGMMAGGFHLKSAIKLPNQWG